MGRIEVAMSQRIRTAPRGAVTPLRPPVFYPFVRDSKMLVSGGAGWAPGDGSSSRVLVMLTKWFSSTRLETRTKESNIYASIRVLKTRDAQ